MSLPLLGPLTMSGFARPWYFLFLLVVGALVGLYVGVHLSRRRRTRRFADQTMLKSVAPKRFSRWRHLPALLVAVALLVLTVGLAGPTRDVHVPRNRAVVMLILDVSPSMKATDVAPTRLDAAEEAARQFADELTPGVNLGLIAFGGNALVLVSPTTNHEATRTAIGKLQFIDGTAIGESITAALQSIATVGSVVGGGSGPPPARIVLLSDGKENRPASPDAPKGAFTAARLAKDQGVPISAISFGTPNGTIEYDDARVEVPVAPETLKTVAELSGGTLYNAANLGQLKDVYASLQGQFGYDTVAGDASTGWARLGALIVAVGVIGALLLNRRLPI